MTTRETYSISVDGLTAALAELVKQIRTQDPSLGTIRCKLYDGSAVSARAAARSVARCASSSSRSRLSRAFSSAWAFSRSMRSASSRAIDGMANIIKALVEPIEEHLLEQETFAERHEARRKDELRAAREEALRALGTDPRSYANLGETDEETWAITLQTAKDARDARVRSEKEAEELGPTVLGALARALEVSRIAAQKREAERKERAPTRAREERPESTRPCGAAKTST